VVNREVAVSHLADAAAVGLPTASCQRIGSAQVSLANRIKRMMPLIGNQPVMWVNVISLLAGGPYSESNMLSWNRADPGLRQLPEHARPLRYLELRQLTPAKLGEHHLAGYGHG
jgi:hypothetical protein